MNARLLRDSHQVLRTRARSFRWGQAFLSAAQADDAARVYAFCRLVDDTADEADDVTLARLALTQLGDELVGRAVPSEIVAAYLEVAERCHIHHAAALQLCQGCGSDLDTVRLQDDNALLLYAYRVAGTVGLMMVGLLEAHDERAAAPAIDLGIAMQLTNICRDVKEDAALGRVYLPASRLSAHGMEPEEVLNGNAPPKALFAVTAEVLALAERYYQSAEAGLAWLPARARLAILVAARLYRAIGVRLLHDGPVALSRRTVVGVRGKLGWTVAAGGSWAASLTTSRAPAPHVAELHAPLRGLPGIASFLAD